MASGDNAAPRMPDWNKEADFYNAFVFCELEDTETYLDTIGIDPDDSVLDVCCGPGRIAVLAAERAARVTAFDSAERMLELACANAKARRLTNIDFKLMDWDCVLPGQNLQKHDVVIASRNQAIGQIAKLSALANKKVAIQIFADAPSIPELVGVFYAGCGMPTPGKRPQAGGPASPADATRGYMGIANSAYAAGYRPNIHILPERFRKTFDSAEAACEWVCSLRPQFSAGNEERIASNIEPFLTAVDDGFELCIATTAAIIWWDVR